MAWLNATPKPDPRTKRGKQDTGQENRPSRLEQNRRDGIEPKMPPNPAPHITARLLEIGLTESNGMGLTPLSWGEIVNWQQATGVALPPWEARLLRRLSTEYIAEGRKAESENCPPPWRAEVTKREREIEQSRLEMVLG